MRQNQGVSREFMKPRENLKERQVLNYRICTHKKSLHSEVDNPVYDTYPSKMENHLLVTLPHHDLKIAAESVPGRQSRETTSDYASDFMEEKKLHEYKAPDLEKLVSNGTSLEFW